MDENEKIDFAQYEWQENWLSQYHYYVNRFNRFSMELMGYNHLLPPLGFVATKDVITNLDDFRRFSRRYKTMYLCDVVKAIGIEDEASVANLQQHWKRVRQYNNLILPLSYLLAIVILTSALLILIGSLFAIYRDFSDSFDSLLDSTFAFVLFMFLFLVLIQVSRRIVHSVLNRYYGNTLVVVSAIFFMVDLLRKEALTSFSNRRHLQSQLHALGQYALQLAYQFKSESPEDQLWIYSHFKGLERYVREHERLIVAPKPDSLEILRRDFYLLMKILITGNYGEFAYDYQSASESATPKSNRTLRVILGFVGFLIPSFVLYMLYSYPQRIVDMGINVNTVTMVSLAWLLLTIDATLKLGIVERITGLAKTIRDLG